MHRKLGLLFGAALLGLAHAQQPQVTAPPGPRFTNVPKEVAKRQDDEGGHVENVEIHQDYGAPVGVDTQYLTMDGSTTKVSYHLTPMTLGAPAIASSYNVLESPKTSLPV